jgi:tetratricopeptide (TPR) repeat protein
MIGGSEPGAGNVISGNDGSGVAIAISENWTAQNAIFGNAIYSNAGLGIDLGDDGVTSNDALDADSGPNQRQNFPILTSAISGATSTTIEGTLNSTANTTFTLEFFSSSACDPSGHGEGEDFLGSNDVMTDGSGNTGFLVTLGTALPSGQFITATATDPDGNTSEFSACIELLTPEEALNSSIEDLQSIVKSNPDTDLAKEVEAAIKKLDEALDELSETFPNNKRAVGKIKEAVKKLDKAFDEGLDKAIDEGLDPVQGAPLMDQLSAIARQFAADALAWAIAQEGDQARIADADQALSDGDALRASEAFEDAVKKYKEALKKAESALP